MRKILPIFLIILIFTSPISFGEEVDYKAAVLMDYNTGDYIFKVNEDMELPPASITKIMTLLLTMEAIESNQLSLEDEIVVSDYASGMGGTQIYLDGGEIQRIEDLIKAVCIRSANDAAVALGEAVAGSNDAFVNLMNERAKQLNMNNTNFVNATGLTANNHYTSANDVSLMTRELLRHEKIIEYLTIYMEDILVGRNKDVVQTMVNTNRLVRNYEGITGVKTGFTNEAGYCLSASANRNGMKLISVILGADNSANRFDKAAELLDYGFASYNSILIDKINSKVGELKVDKGDVDKVDLTLARDSYALIPKTSDYEIEKEIISPSSILAPIKKGHVLGKLNVYIGDKEIDSIDLISEIDVEEANYINLLKKTIKTFISNN